MELKKYTWSFNKNDEMWGQSTFNTIDECISDAKEQYNFKECDVIAVGETVKFSPCIDADDVIERLSEEAYEHAGEASDGWLHFNHNQLDSLSEQLTNVLKKWLIETDNEPSFYHIENIREITI